MSIALAVTAAWGRMTFQRSWRGWGQPAPDRRLAGRRALSPPRSVERRAPERRVPHRCGCAAGDRRPIDLVIGLLSSVLIAGTFIVVLWHVGGPPEVAVLGGVLTVPGYLVAAAVVYAILTTCACAKVVNRRPSVAFLVPCPYRRGHDHPSVRCRFPALVPGTQPRFAGGLRACCSATPGDRPASATPRPASALLHRPVALGLALPDLAAGPQHHGGGQTGNRRPVASERIRLYWRRRSRRLGRPRMSREQTFRDRVQAMAIE